MLPLMKLSRKTSGDNKSHRSHRNKVSLVVWSFMVTRHSTALTSDLQPEASGLCGASAAAPALSDSMSLSRTSSRGQRPAASHLPALQDDEQAPEARGSSESPAPRLPEKTKQSSRVKYAAKALVTKGILAASGTKNWRRK